MSQTGTDGQIAEKCEIENNIESTIPTEIDQQNEPHDNILQTNTDGITEAHQEKATDLNTTTVPCTMEVTETPQETVEMETVSENTSELKEIQSVAKGSKTIGSLGLLNQYASSSEEDEDSSESEEETDSEDSADSSVEVVSQTPASKDNELNSIAKDILNSVISRENYREAQSSEMESDDSDVECIGSIPAQTIDITNDEEIQEFLDACEGQSEGPMKTKGELGMEDLPPIAELTITVSASDCVELGKVSGIVDTLVLVESLPGFAAVDIDTVLFLDKGDRTLGQVFDVMGIVSSPIYCVRFNSTLDIREKNITVGMTVYVAPQTEYTNFIVLSNLMKEKGCDASWENDNEAPDGCNEFSDDEEELLNRKQNNQKQRNRNRPSDGDQLPNKVTVKSEPNSNGRPKGKQRNNWPGQANRQPTRFYKDNRGYANVNPDAGAFYQQQRMYPTNQNYSWHTAAMHGMPPPSTSSARMPYAPYAANTMGPHVYPNPFAMPGNQMNYSPFNLQAFPPLPPPNSSIPPHHQPPQNAPHYNRKKSNSYQPQ